MLKKTIDVNKTSSLKSIIWDNKTLQLASHLLSDTARFDVGTVNGLHCLFLSAFGNVGEHCSNCYRLQSSFTGYSPASSFQPRKSGAISSSPYLYNLDDIPDVHEVNFQMCVGLIPSLMDLSGCRKEEFCLGVQLKP